MSFACSGAPGMREYCKVVSRAHHPPPPVTTTCQPRTDAKFAGAVLGVSLGCIVGMAPLAFMETGFFEKAPPKAPEGSAAAADLMSA